MKRVFATLLLLVLCFAGAITAAWQLSPGFREKLLLSALLSGISPVQQKAAKALYDYPTRTAALSLVAFANQQAPEVARIRALEQRVEDLRMRLRAAQDEQDAAAAALEKELAEASAEYEAEKKQFDATYDERSELANTAITSLCRMTGEDFGTYFEQEAFGFTWSNIGRKAWPEAIAAINRWAFETFGPELLSFPTESKDESGEEYQQALE